MKDRLLKFINTFLKVFLFMALVAAVGAPVVMWIIGEWSSKALLSLFVSVPLFVAYIDME